MVCGCHSDLVLLLRHYLILDEAHYIKNFKSQRWQTLLTLSSRRRLLLTGTPLQNSLMELWALMHFLMPHLFRSQEEFKQWFSTPLTSHVEGGPAVDMSLVRRLHAVLRPFVLRRLKSEVAKQLPGKFEHVLKCRLSTRQRFLYEDFMSRSSTRAKLASGSFLSMMNVLMQLRKVCNHPDLFEPRPIISPMRCPLLEYRVPTLVLLNRFAAYPFSPVDPVLASPVPRVNGRPTVADTLLSGIPQSHSGWLGACACFEPPCRHCHLRCGGFDCAPTFVFCALLG